MLGTSNETSTANLDLVNAILLWFVVRSSKLRKNNLQFLPKLSFERGTLEISTQICWSCEFFNHKQQAAKIRPKKNSTMASSHRRSKGKDPRHSYIHDDDSPDEAPLSAKKRKASESKQNEKKDKNSNDIKNDEWTTEELAALIGNIKALVPSNDNLRFNTSAQKLSWEKVQFGRRSKNQCREKWSEITTKLRKFRTLTELLTDAEEWVKHPWSSSLSKKSKPHPDMPKKPLTPYFRYFLEKRQKYAMLHPKMSMTDLAKIIAGKFHELSVKKKAKYQEMFNTECVQYKEKLEAFKQSHPQYFSSVSKEKKADAIQKPQTPFQLFRAKKLLKFGEVNTENKPEVLAKIKKHWTNLSDGRRMKWIRKGLTDEARYITEREEYISEHPDYKPPLLKSTLTKAERELKDRFDGKPEKPPNSGYGLYSKIMLKELTSIPSKDKMSEISRRWKSLSDKEKDSYNFQATELNGSYKEQFEKYLSNLTSEEREKALEPPPKKLKRSPAVKELIDYIEKPQKPTSAEYFYQCEKLPVYELSSPALSKVELITQIASEYKSLPAKQKQKYIKMSAAAIVKNASNSGSKKSSKILFKNEPKRPPRNAYSLFASDMLKSLTGEPRDRMSQIGERWKALSEEQQKEYKERVTELNRKYNKDYSKFLKNLTPEEITSFENLKSGNKVPVPDVKIKEEVVSSSSGSSNDGDSTSSSDESDSSSSNDDDDDKDSSSDDSSSDDSDSSSEDSSSQVDSSNDNDGSNSESDDDTVKKK